MRVWSHLAGVGQGPGSLKVGPETSHGPELSDGGLFCISEASSSVLTLESPQPGVRFLLQHYVIVLNIDVFLCILQYFTIFYSILIYFGRVAAA